MSKTLPPDPKGMNDNYAAFAGKALDAFIAASGADEEDAVGDLLSDLMHWCDRNNYDFDLAFDRALSHYEAETAGEDAGRLGVAHATESESTLITAAKAALADLQGIMPEFEPS